MILRKENVLSMLLSKTFSFLPVTEKAEGGCDEVEGLSNQPTIIQIPENMLSMLTKKDPVKIGTSSSVCDIIVFVIECILYISLIR